MLHNDLQPGRTMIKANKNHMKHTEIQHHQPICRAAAAACAAIDEYQLTLEAGCYSELAHCSSSTGIPEELSKHVDDELAALQQAQTQLDAALKKARALADELKARRHDTRKAVDRRWYRLNPPANCIIDRQEQEKQHFAAGMNLNKLILVFIIGSFVGVVVETLWCLLRRGYYESRNGLLWGPFSPLYGLGAVALSIALYRWRNRGSWLSFLGGFVIGSVVEYVCSWWQEWAFGSTSWDYSAMPFNINGRVCLLYSVFWGFLGVAWMKDIYPRLSKWILRIPRKPGVIITRALAVFMAINCAVSGMAVLRWSERMQGLEPANAYEVFMDEHFPDARMESIWANMDFGTQSITPEGEEAP